MTIASLATAVGPGVMTSFTVVLGMRILLLV